jgi:methylamine--corrinoid protein Co-methyltransferase
VSGADLDLLAVARNKHPEYASGMEARIGAEAGHVVAWQGMKREQVNELVKQLLTEYEDQIEEAPLGKRFDECYDLTRVQPTQEYLDLYEQRKAKLTKLGMDYTLV